MLDGLELRERLAADALTRRIGRDQVGEILFEIQQFVIEAVVSLVGDGGPRLDVIGVIVAAKFGGELRVAGFGLCVSHRVNVKSVAVNLPQRENEGQPELWRKVRRYPVSSLVKFFGEPHA